LHKNVIVFRKRLLPYSETFIADQGKYLASYKANYCGLKRQESGIKLLGGSSCFLLDGYSHYPQIEKIKFRLGLPNKNWISDLNALKSNLIHAHFLNDGMDALRLKNKLNIPLITTLHGHDITKKEKPDFFNISRKDFFCKVDKIIAVSDYIYQHALKNGCPEDKIIQHSIGIDVQKFTQVKNESEIPEILFVGRLVEKKGLVYLLEALKLIKDKFPDLKLTIVGDGPLKKKLIEKASYDNISVEFVGKESPEKVRERLAKTWVFAAPSITADDGDAEGLGMVFLEAQALNTPVVSFASGGVVEAVADGVTGVLSKEKDVKALAESIEFFIDDAAARQQYGARGRKRIEELFDVRKQCLLLEDIYDSVR